MKKIEVGKEYKTRDGKVVKIYATDGNGRYPIQGAMLNTGGRWDHFIKMTWMKDGSFVKGVPDQQDIVTKLLPSSNYGVSGIMRKIVAIILLILLFVIIY